MAYARKVAPIGEILVLIGKINSHQLEAALEKQKETPDDMIGKILIEQGYISEDDLHEALAIQYAYPYLPVDRYKVSKEIKGILPIHMIQKYRFLPVEKVDDVLIGVMDNPCNADAIRAVQEYTKCTIRQCFCYKDLLDSQITIYSKFTG